MNQPPLRTLWFLLLVISVALLLPASSLCTPPKWETLAPGLEFARVSLPGTTAPADSFIAVLRADPFRWDLHAFSATEQGDSIGLSARSWARNFGLAATINAGMYDRDRITHIGQLVTHTHSHNTRIHPMYKSLAVFEPVEPGDVPFAILDRESHSFDNAARRWNGRVQNLRLIQSPGDNRWEQGGRKWIEAALAEDNTGRILFLYCPVALSMHDFNEYLLSMPLGVTTAQHLEGGVRAQLFIQVGDRIVEFHTGHETDFTLGYEPPEGIAIPNALGLRAKK
ncbi:MAG: phosphodiester glycosidase family protein [bacterium]